MTDEVRSLWEQFLTTRSLDERNRLFEHYRRLVWATRNRVIPYTNEREDLEQDGAIQLLRAIEGYDPERETKFETYAIAQLTGFYRNKLRDSRRYTSRHVQDDPEFEMDEWVESHEESPEAYVLRKEREALIRRYLIRLPAKQRRVLYMRYWLGLRQIDCARLLEVSQPAILQLERKGCNSLRKYLQAALE